MTQSVKCGQGLGSEDQPTPTDLAPLHPGRACQHRPQQPCHVCRPPRQLTIQSCLGLPRHHRATGVVFDPLRPGIQAGVVAVEAEEARQPTVPDDA